MMITWTQVYVGKDKRLYNDRCWHGVIQLGKKKKKKKKKRSMIIIIICTVLLHICTN